MKNIEGNLKIILKGEIHLFIQVLDTYLLYYTPTNVRHTSGNEGSELNKTKPLPSESLHFSRET